MLSMERYILSLGFFNLAKVYIFFPPYNFLGKKFKYLLEGDKSESWSCGTITVQVLGGGGASSVGTVNWLELRIKKICFKKFDIRKLNFMKKFLKLNWKSIEFSERKSHFKKFKFKTETSKIEFKTKF